MGHELISVIIPVCNESPGISDFAGQIRAYFSQCEILFVDGGSTDDTVDRLAKCGAEIVKSPKKGRAAQMNFGAALSSGSILWFLHADSIPPPDALRQIQAVLGKGFEVGCFRLKFDSKSILMRLNALLSNNLRVRVRNIAFGDQGIFIRRALFDSIGGYAAIPLMEDYQLSLDVSKAGHKIGITKGKIVTSERRYLEGGRMKTIRMMWTLQRNYRKGGDIEEIKDAYYRRRNEDS